MNDPLVLTPSQTSGPLYGFGLLFDGSERTVEPGDPGALAVRGVILDGAGDPVAHPDALVELWSGAQFARTRTDEHGEYRFLAAAPAPEPLPDGRLQAPHFNVTVFARGLLKQLQTRMYLPGDAANDDPVLARIAGERRSTLIAREEDGALRFDIRIQGEGETVFFDF